LTTIEDDVAAVSRIDVAPKILDVVCRTTGMGFAAVARVTENRWVACAVKDDIAFGLKPGGELDVVSTICDEIRDSGVAVVIDHVAEDDDFRDHHTPRQYGFQSYISVPIRRNGEFFGTLCAIDPRPAKLKTPEVIGMFELFAELIGSHLEAETQLAKSQAALLDAQATSELRDQFIAVLGHDLRNPLAAIDGGVRLLSKTPLNERGTWVVGEVRKSVDRMASLIDDVLDFARGRLGGGIGVVRRPEPGLRDALETVVAELKAAHPDRAIHTKLNASRPRPRSMSDASANCCRTWPATPLPTGPPTSLCGSTPMTVAACSSCQWPMAAHRSRPTPPSACSNRSSASPRLLPKVGWALASISPPRSPAPTAATWA
jgi:hypothetical protein